MRLMLQDLSDHNEPRVGAKRFRLHPPPLLPIGWDTQGLFQTLPPGGAHGTHSQDIHEARPLCIPGVYCVSVLECFGVCVRSVCVCDVRLLRWYGLVVLRWYGLVGTVDFNWFL